MSIELIGQRSFRQPLWGASGGDRFNNLTVSHGVRRGDVHNNNSTRVCGGRPRWGLGFAAGRRREGHSTTLNTVRERENERNRAKKLRYDGITRRLEPNPNPKKCPRKTKSSTPSTRPIGPRQTSTRRSGATPTRRGTRTSLDDARLAETFPRETESS